MTNDRSIEKDITRIGSPDGAVREAARNRLVSIGEPAVPALVVALKSDERRIQWEAAKALKSIASEDAAPHLAEVLEDNDLDIRWLASEALLGLGRVGLGALLDRLAKSSDVHLHESAGHVLGRADSRYESILAPVLDALRGSDSDETTMVAADQARAKLNEL